MPPPGRARLIREGYRTSGPPPDARVGGIEPMVGVPRIFFGAFA